MKDPPPSAWIRSIARKARSQKSFCAARAFPTSSSPTSVPWSAARFSSTPASSAIRARTRSLPTVCTKACRIKACAAGSRLTMLKPARSSTSRLTRPSACMTSEWVKTEIAKARKRELNEGKRVLFPVRLVEFETLRDWECFDGDTGKDLAREIAEYFIPDFANWKDHDSYQKAFERLLKDLKSPDAGAKSVAPAKD